MVAALVSHRGSVYPDGIPDWGATHQAVGVASAQFHRAWVAHAHVTTLVEYGVHAAVKAHQAASVSDHS